MTVSDVRYQAFGYAIVAAYLMIQIMPIAQLLGLGEFLLRDDGSIATPTISFTPGETYLILLQWFGLGTIFYLAAQVGASRMAIWLLTGLFAAVVTYALIGVVFLTMFGDTFLWFPKLAYAGYATATFVNRNSYATFLAIGLAIGAALLAGSIQRPKHHVRAQTIALLAAAELIVLVALVASGSRMGLFVGALGTACVAALSPRTRFRFKALLAILALGLGAVLLVSIGYGGSLIDRLGGIGAAFDLRIELYRQAWTMAWARPLWGFGAGSFQLAFQLFHSPPLESGLIWNKAHSSYLTSWIELGLPVGSIIMITIGIAAALAARPLLVGPMRRIPIAVVGVTIVVAVHSLVDFSLEVQANAYLLATILGLGAGYATVVTDEKQGSTS